MTRFYFEAMGSTGETESGHIQAADANSARQLLRQKGLFVTQLAELAEDDASPSPAISPDFLASRAERAGRSPAQPGRWIGAFSMVVGLAAFALGLYGVIDSILFRSRAERATAVVVDREVVGSKGYDVLRFESSGREYRVPRRGCFGLRDGAPRYSGVGYRWEVLYQPDDPDQARVADFNRNFGGPIVLVGLGLLFTPVGLLVMRRGLKVTRE